MARPKQDHIERFWSRVKKTSNCWLFSQTEKVDGYGILWLNGTYVRAHRLSYQIHRGSIPNGAFILHKCDVPNCVRPSHLFIGDNSANMVDRSRKGRGTGKLDAKSVLEIRARRKAGETTVFLGKEYGVRPSTISSIAHRRYWRHI